MNLSAIFSKTGKGVQEASGKTSHLSRGDRAVLSAIDGKTSLAEVQKKSEKLAGPKFDALIQQLDKDGYIREVSAGTAQPAAPAARTSAPPPRAAPRPPKAPAASGGDDEALDFTQAIQLPPKPAAPKAPPVDLAAASHAEADRKANEQQGFDYKSRQEAEAKAKAEAEVKARAAAEARTKAEAEGKARAEAEAKAREAAEAKGRAESDTKSRAESDAKVKSAREAALRMAAEAKAKTDAAVERERDANEREREANERARKEAEAKARLEAELTGKLEDAERRAREAGDQARREIEEKSKRDAEELRQRLEAEMTAKLEEERKKRAEEDRKRREEDQLRRKEEDERRAKEDADRRAKEEAERRAREEEDRKRRKEEDERRAKEAADRRAKEDAERRKRDDDERRNREEAERKANDEAEAKARASQSASLPSIQPAVPAATPPAAAAGGDIGDSLLADLDSFTQREDEEAKAQEEAERKAKEEAARRAKAEAERRAKDDAERRAKEEADKKRRENEERKEKEEAAQRAREEEERQKQEEAERKRKAKEALAAKQGEEKAARKAAQRTAAGTEGAGDDDIGVTDDDLDKDDIKRDQKALAKTARKTALEQPAVAAVAARRPKKWGKPAAAALFVLLVGGVGVLHVMPISTSDYEKAASEAMGVPVKIGSARLSLISGIELRFEDVSVGDAVKIKLVRGFREIGSLFGATIAFSRMELEGVSVSQSQLADAVLGKVSGQNFRVGRVMIKQAKLDGPLTLPALDVEATVSDDGSLQSVTLRGGDKLSVQLSPKGNDIGFEISAGSLALPFVPALTLSEFGMKGTANRQGVVSSEFDGRAFDGVISGTAKIRWGANWNVDGEVRARGVKVAVFAPALVSEGKVEGRAAYSMSGSTPANLFETARVQGEFKIEKGVLGSFDLTRALQTGGAQSGGRTVFSELTGQGLYDKGAIQIRNVAITAGAMNAGASLDVDASGGLSGRITADVKTPTQTLRATLNLSGKVRDPVIRK